MFFVVMGVEKNIRTGIDEKGQVQFICRLTDGADARDLILKGVEFVCTDDLIFKIAADRTCFDELQHIFSDTLW